MMETSSSKGEESTAELNSSSSTTTTTTTTTSLNPSQKDTNTTLIPAPAAPSTISSTLTTALTSTVSSSSSTVLPASTNTIVSTLAPLQNPITTSTGFVTVSTTTTTGNTSTISTTSASSSTSSVLTTKSDISSQQQAYVTTFSSTTSPASTSVTISLGVGALQQPSKSSPPLRTNAASIPNISQPIRDGNSQKTHEIEENIKTNIKDSTTPSAIAVGHSKQSPSTINTTPPSLVDGPSGMKRPAPGGGESGSSGPSSAVEADSDTSAVGDPKKKKMRKDTQKETRSESPGVTTTTTTASTSSTSGNSARGNRGGTGKQLKGNTTTPSSTKGETKALAGTNNNNSGTSSTTSSSLINPSTITTATTVTTSNSVSSTASTTTVTSESSSTTSISSVSNKSGQSVSKPAVALSSESSTAIEKTEESGKTKTGAVALVGSESNGGNGCPKVPPLKIVLQSHLSATSSASSSSNSGTLTAGKSNKEKDNDDQLHHTSIPTGGFPYIVSSTTPDTVTLSKEIAGNIKSTSPPSSATPGNEEHKDNQKQQQSGGTLSTGPAVSSATSSVPTAGNLSISSTPEISSSQPAIELRKPSTSPPVSVTPATSSNPSSTCSSSVTSSSVSSSSTNNHQTHSSSLDKSRKESSSPPRSEVTSAENNKSKSEESTSLTGNSSSSSAASTLTGAGNSNKDGGNKKEKTGVSSSSATVEEKEISKDKIDRENSTSTSGPKEKPTRVTRSSHRILEKTGATPNSPSSISPKTSACPSPSTSQHGDDQKPEVVEKMDTTETVDLHPRKRKLKPTKELKEVALPVAGPSVNVNATATTDNHTEPSASGANNASASSSNNDPPPMMNCFEMYFNIRKQIARRRRNLFPVTPKPPKGFKDYLMNRGTYILQGNPNSQMAVPLLNPPTSLSLQMKDTFVEQEKARHKLRLQHLVEKEKLVLSVEQEILRVHGRAARALSNQTLPFSVCTILKDEEVYSLLTPEQEEKDINARSRYNGRLFLSWLQDVDDKWDKIKEQMLLRHHNEAESLHAVQKMDWEWKLKEVGLCEPKATPLIEEHQVPIVNVSDDFDLLPA